MISFSDYLHVAGSLLEKIAEYLDIPDHLYEDAVIKYEDIGEWLSGNDSDLIKYLPEIYPQGSFRLGTVVHPISDEEEYDIDLVCRLEIDKKQTTQAELKEKIGSRLKQRDDLKKILESSRRCWILNFPKQFHMDVLPSIPNLERLPTGILLTDIKLTHWQKSNPKAYAEWFYRRMAVAIQESRVALAKSIQANIEDVPEWKVKTPLQRSIQLLKRHRDIYFQNELENKPASIIITTLAAKGYQNQLNIIDAITKILEDMPKYIENRNGKWLVVNPVDPDENFADKWNEKPELEKAFRLWINKAYEDFCNFKEKTNSLNEQANLLKGFLGEQLVINATKNINFAKSGSFYLINENTSKLPELGDINHVLPGKWSMNKKYKASVKGIVYHRNRRKKLWTLRNNATVPKKVWIKFKIDTNTPHPYQVKWQVVNTGQKAFEANQLRGDFYDNDSAANDVRWESTAYKGTHWVEAFIIKDNVCVAKSGQTYVRVR